MFCVAQKPQDKQGRMKGKYERERVGGDTEDEIKMMKKKYWEIWE